MSTRDRRVLGALQGLLLLLPLFLGGRQPLAVFVAAAVVGALLIVTARARHDIADAPAAPGVGVLAAFALLAFFTTVPLPPALLALVSPEIARRTAELLPGWPGAGGWSTWRSLAMDPYGVTLELSRIAIGLGAFSVAVAYPWRTDDWDVDARAKIVARLLLTVIAGGVLLAALALLEQIAGNGRVLWIGEPVAQRGRASGSFVNPNHLAAWLEMTLPVALAYTLALAARLRRRLARAVHTGRGMGVRARRAWIAALIAQQRMIWPPLAAAFATTLILVAHIATGSRGGGAALLVGAVLAAGGAASTAASERLRRWVPMVGALALILVTTGMLAVWATSEPDTTTVESADPGLGSRLLVSTAGVAIVRDYPLVGSGLGSWLHAFRPYQEPPVPGGIWDHAHDDYVELVAETGAIGLALAALFAFLVARAARGRRETPAASVPSTELRWRIAPRLEASEWQSALGERTLLRFGLAGGVSAVLVHSLVDFGLHLPANLLLLMVLLALLVLSGERQPASRCRGLAVLAAVIVLALTPRAMNNVRSLFGAHPLAPRDQLDAADLRLAEDGDAGRSDALILVHGALDANPFDREAHEALASALGAGPESEDALRRALLVQPWSAEVRDRLGLALIARGEHATGAAELEESMRRLPAMVSHAYLSPETALEPQEPRELLRSLTDGDTLQLRLTALTPEVTGAVEHGLRHALDNAAAGPARAAIIDDLVTLLEVGERWADAAALLHAEADRGVGDGTYLARAAQDYLKAHADAEAEKALLAALVRAPDQGDLYRKLAVEVYAARGDFATADTVLTAAQQSAIDLLPVYHAVSEVLSKRDAAREDERLREGTGSADDPLLEDTPPAAPDGAL